MHWLLSVYTSIQQKYFCANVKVLLETTSVQFAYFIIPDMVGADRQ